ncbi:MAG: hypothetical protein RLZ54_799 [Candidatus Parcubacteria bacterium]
MKKVLFVLFLLCGLVYACVKENATSQEIPTQTTVSVDSSDYQVLNETTERSAGSWNVSLTNFKHVWQNRLPTDWKTASYITSGSGYIYSCSYPMYNGTYSYSNVANSNLCGIASLLMAEQLVSHPSLVDLPTGTNGRAVRLLESANRYKLFDGSYSFGNVCYIDKIRLMANGIGSPTNKKGDLTNWSNCSTYAGAGTSWGGTTNRATVKAFFESKISAGKPCVSLIRVNPSSSCADADCSTYIRTNGTGTGHMVTVVGLTTNAAGVGTIRFKDPWPNNAKTYEVDYDKFLDSMKSASSSNIYNVFSVNGM